MMEHPKGFLIHGRVFATDDQQGQSGLRVLALDKDLLTDDCLGETTTDDHGYFEIVFSEKDFRENFLDARPDIYLQVYNRYGNLIWSSEDKVRYNADSVEQFAVGISRSALSRQPAENSRLQFKQLIKVNPNYFGTAVGPLAEQFQVVEAFSGNTNYEDLCGVGLYPEKDLLEAVIRIKRNYGYGGNLCSLGSTEYVAFYLDFGSGWVSTGPAAKVRVHNLQATLDGHIHYAVKQHFSFWPYLEQCNDPQIIKVRAILSWNNIPTHAGYTPVYGQVVEEFIQVRPRTIFVGPVKPKWWEELGFLTDPVIPIDPIVVGPGFPEPPQPPQPLPVAAYFQAPKLNVQASLGELKTLLAQTDQTQAGKEVEEARFNMLPLLQKNPNYFGSFSPDPSPEVIQKSLSTLPPFVKNSFLQIDPALLKPVWIDNPKTNYEQLRCVGMYPEEGVLEAIVELKRESGYSGNLCTAGSREYVSFYIDYGDGGGFQSVGTVQFRAHDISRPDKQNPLSYAVQLPVEGLEERMKSCEEENVVRVRAILSWNVNPEPFGPYYNPGWGNVLTVRVLIRPLYGPSVQCEIDFVSNVNIENVDQLGSIAPGSMGVGHAFKADGTPNVFDRPFAGLMEFRGQVNVAGAHYYKCLIKPYGAPDSEYRELVNPFYHYLIGNTIHTTLPAVDKWFSIATFIANYNHPDLNSQRAFLHWESWREVDGVFTLKLLLGDAARNPIPGQEAVAHFRTYREGLETYFFNTPSGIIPSKGLTVKGDGVPQVFKRCGKFAGKELIHVWGNFAQLYYTSFRMKVFGGNIEPTGVVLPPNPNGLYDDPTAMGIASDGTIIHGDLTDGSEIYAFDMASVPPMAGFEHISCAYGIETRISLRTLIGSFGAINGFGVYSPATDLFTTFNWDPNA